MELTHKLKTPKVIEANKQKYLYKVFTLSLSVYGITAADFFYYYFEDVLISTLIYTFVFFLQSLAARLPGTDFTNCALNSSCLWFDVTVVVEFAEVS